MTEKRLIFAHAGCVLRRARQRLPLVVTPLAALLVLVPSAFAQDESPEVVQFLLDTMAEMGAMLEEGREEVAKTGCALPVWHRGFPLRVTFVPEYAKKFGLRQGDYLVSLNGVAIPEEAAEQARFISDFGAGSWVELEIVRAQEFETIAIRCDDARIYADLFGDIIASLKARDVAACQSSLNELYRQQGGSAPFTFLEVELLCTMAGNGAEYNRQTLSLMAQAIIMRIDSEKLFPDGFDEVAESSRRKIRALEEFGEVDLADHVREVLDEAQAFIRDDPPYPGADSERRAPEVPMDADGIDT